MKRHTLITISFATLLLSSCKQAPFVEHQECDLNMQDRGIAAADDPQNPDEPAAPRACIIPEPEPGANLTYNITTSDFDDKQQKKLEDALERMELVINSAEFKRRVLAHTYNGEKTFVQNNGLTNEEVYQKIMEAAESLMPEVDEEMDLDITLYYRSNSTVGYTYANTTRIWMNNKFFSGYNLGEVAGNVTHEWTHKIGFGHDSNSTARRPYSVPYGVGKIMRELVEKM